MVKTFFVFFSASEDSFVDDLTEFITIFEEVSALLKDSDELPQIAFHRRQTSVMGLVGRSQFCLGTKFDRATGNARQKRPKKEIGKHFCPS